MYISDNKVHFLYGPPKFQKEYNKHPTKDIYKVLDGTRMLKWMSCKDGRKRNMFMKLQCYMENWEKWTTQTLLPKKRKKERSVAAERMSKHFLRILAIQIKNGGCKTENIHNNRSPISALVIILSRNTRNVHCMKQSLAGSIGAG